MSVIDCTEQKKLEERVLRFNAEERVLSDLKQLSFDNYEISAYLEQVMALLSSRSDLPIGCFGFIRLKEPWYSCLHVNSYTARKALSGNGVQDWIFPLSGGYPCLSVPRRARKRERIPLIHGKEELGDLNIELASDTHFTYQEREFMCRITAVIAEAVSQKLKEMNTLHQAMNDELTDLPNKRMLFNWADRHWKNPEQSQGENNILLLIDIDNLKQINDSLGSKIANGLLRNVGERLTGIAKPGDFIAHIDSDLFCLVLRLEEASDEARIAATYEVQRLMRNPIFIDGNHLFATLSIGVASMNEARTLEELLNQAELALHAARRSGRGNVRCYAPVFSE